MRIEWNAIRISIGGVDITDKVTAVKFGSVCYKFSNSKRHRNRLKVNRRLKRPIKSLVKYPIEQY